MKADTPQQQSINYRATLENGLRIAEAVLSNWDSGDLAAAVRDLAGWRDAAAEVLERTKPQARPKIKIFRPIPPATLDFDAVNSRAQAARLEDI